MLSSIDGRLHASKWTRSPDGDPKRWSTLYEDYQDTLKADAWLVGRTTMAEMSKATAHPVTQGATPARPVHRADGATGPFAIAVDTSGSLHFDKPAVNGNHVIVALGANVPDDHLRELAADGVSYIVADAARIDLAALLETLSTTFGIRRLALEGGAAINGSFFAAGLVDELQVIVGPGLDARTGADGIIENGEEGLAGRVELTFAGCEVMAAGCVRLSYAVGRARTLERGDSGP
jgi:riboflavin biosynthesis pyrimidine reductase